MKIYVACVSCVLLLPTVASAEIIFESSTLGPTGVAWSELENQTVPGTNLHSSIFVGVRFELSHSVVTSQVGGHFVQRFAGTFFGAVVSLDNADDFPNSTNLSTPDVLGTTTLTFPNPSAEVVGNLNLSLNPGWYALVFGSGLFGTAGVGGAVRNGAAIGDPTYIGRGPNLGWFNFDTLPLSFDNHRFVINGTMVPEPSTLLLAVGTFAPLAAYRRRRG